MDRREGTRQRNDRIVSLGWEVLLRPIIGLLSASPLFLVTAVGGAPDGDKIRLKVKVSLY